MNDYKQMVIYAYDIILLVAETHSYKLTLRFAVMKNKFIIKYFKIVDNEKKKNYNNKSHHMMTK